MADTISQMPMPNALRAPLGMGSPTPSANISPLRAPLGSPAPSPEAMAPAPAPSAPPPMPADPGNSAPGVPWKTKLQQDGSAAFYVDNPTGGEPIYIGIAKAPKLPPALQPKPAAQ